MEPAEKGTELSFHLLFWFPARTFLEEILEREKNEPSKYFLLLKKFVGFGIPT